MKKIIEMDNIVRASNSKDIQTYGWSTLLRGQPRIYSKYGRYIKIRFTADLRILISDLSRILWHCGFIPMCIIKMPHGFEVRDGRYMNVAYELILKKIGAIEFEDDSDYEKWLVNKDIDFKNIKKCALQDYPEEYK